MTRLVERELKDVEDSIRCAGLPTCADRCNRNMGFTACHLPMVLLDCVDSAKYPAAVFIELEPDSKDAARYGAESSLTALFCLFIRHL